MDDTPDPIHQFFSEPEATKPDILYSALNVDKSATAEEIRKSYRRLALKYHPDKHATKTDKEKEAMNKDFQKVGFAYAVLSDEGRRKRYESTGRTDESAFSDAEAMGWEAYFESLFERIDRKILDDDKKKYQGSQDEIDDIKSAYTNSKGNLPSILESIPHSNHTDETRIIKIINGLISSKDLESTKKWETTSTDKKAMEKRTKKGEKEAKEAEAAAKELGVWEEFYGDGSKGKRKGDNKTNGTKGKGKAKAENGEDALAALIQKRQRDREGGLDALADKYAKIEEEEKARKKAKRSGRGRKDPDDDDDLGQNGGTHAEMTDEQFEALQSKMFGNKAKKGAQKGVKA